MSPSSSNLTGRFTAPSLEHWHAAIDTHDVEEVRRLAIADPFWFWIDAPEDCPLVRVLLAKTLAPEARLAMVQALTSNLRPGALGQRDPQVRGVPLWIAAGNGWNNHWVDVISVLLPLSNPNLLHKGSTPLTHAARWGHVPAVVALAPASDPNVPGNHDRTALMEAGQSRDTSSMVPLLDHPGILMDLADKDGRTALILAVRSGNDGAVERLLRAGANPNVQDTRGWTAVMYASAGGVLVNRMLDHHQDQLDQGRPGLDLMLRNDDGQMAEVLVGTDERGAESGPSRLTPAIRQAMADRLRADRLAQETALLLDQMDPVGLSVATRPHGRL